MEQLDFTFKERYTLDDLKQITRILRSENGCPWDKVQTHQSIRQDFLEETLEALEAIDNDDPVLLREELGDVLFQVVFHSQIEAEQNRFDLDDVISDIAAKLVYRHPHVFGTVKADDVDAVLQNWDALKQKEKHQETAADTLRAVPKTFPALMRAQKIQKRAAKAGLNFGDLEENIARLETAVQRLKESLKGQDFDEIAKEIGETLFQIVNLSRFSQLNAEKCLTNSAEKFINEFARVELQAADQNRELSEISWETV